jgi:hypothetical protein
MTKFLGWLLEWFPAPYWGDFKALGRVQTTPEVQSPPDAAEVALRARKDLIQAIAEAALAKNHAYTYDAAGNHAFQAQGGGLHKLDEATALAIAEVIVDNADGGLTVPYLMGCIGIESVFDPKCENGNYSYGAHVGSNPTEHEDGFDVGIAQLKLKYLMEDRKCDVVAAHAFACDYTKAIPYMATTMKLLLGYADALIQDTKRSDVLEDFMNRYIVATGAYNYGRTGMKNLIATATVLPAHCKVVKQYEQEYAALLKIPSVFD